MLLSWWYAYLIEFTVINICDQVGIRSNSAWAQPPPSHSRERFTQWPLQSSLYGPLQTVIRPRVRHYFSCCKKFKDFYLAAQCQLLYLLYEQKHYVTYTAYISYRDILLRLSYPVTQARIVYPNFEGKKDGTRRLLNTLKHNILSLLVMPGNSFKAVSPAFYLNFRTTRWPTFRFSELSGGRDLGSVWMTPDGRAKPPDKIYGESHLYPKKGAFSAS